MNKRCLSWLGAFLLLSALSAGAAAPKQSRARAAAVKQYQDARFGMFIHWGVYSLLGRGEWVMNNERIRIREYEKLPARFNPTHFHARAWVSMAKAAGIRYLTITAKHHDGFAMFDSKLTTYDIVDATPYHHDPMKDLADECHRQGLKLFFYYSQLDWHHPDYYPRGGTGKSAGRPNHGDWEHYKRFYIGQIRELCTNYGEIGGIWLDGWWDRPKADWGMDELYRMVHELQPRALIANNHHRRPYPGEDFQIFEQDLPGQNAAGFNRAGVSALPLETCRTINNSWGYNAKDQANKSPEELIRYLVSAAGRNANLLLNTGPLPTGELLPAHVARYRAIGKWLRAHGKAIYGTRGGPVPPGPWGVSTWRGKRVYLHLLKPKGSQLRLDYFPWAVAGARWLDGARLQAKPQGDALAVSWTGPLPAGPDRIIELRLREPLPADSKRRDRVRTLDTKQTTYLRARDAAFTGGIRFEADKNALGYWTDAGAVVEWAVRLKQPARFQVFLTYACELASAGARYRLEAGPVPASAALEARVKPTAGWTAFRTDSLGEIELPAGDYPLRVRVIEMPGAAVMNLRSVTLKPARAA